jgi:hypothetical protein
LCIFSAVLAVGVNSLVQSVQAAAPQVRRLINTFT